MSIKVLAILYTTHLIQFLSNMEEKYVIMRTAKGVV
jgi:hypothetical protein